MLFCLRSFVLSMAVLLCATTLNAQSKVILVQIDPTLELEPEDSYGSENEVARHEMDLSNHPELRNPTQRPSGQGVYRDAGCFLADYKLIYRDVTYVLSTYCTSSLKFKNDAPFQPGPTQLPSDLVISDGLLDAVEKTGRRVFTKNFASYFEQQQLMEGDLGLDDTEEQLEQQEQQAREETEFVESEAVFENATEETEEDYNEIEDDIAEELGNPDPQVFENPITPEQEAEEEESFDNLDQRIENELSEGQGEQ